MDKTIVRQKFLENLKTLYHQTPKTATTDQIHTALSHAIMACITDRWMNSTEKHNQKKKACYFSAEFLVGRAVYNNLLCLGILDEVNSLLEEQGLDLTCFEDIEDAALGNGGLGRLAACFLDSAATLDLPLDGYGIRYKYGLFKQSIEDGYQKEQADNWTKFGDPWSVRKEQDAVIVEYQDSSVIAVPYDMPIIGYGTNNVGNLRLWQAEAANDFDFTLFNDQHYTAAVKDKNAADDISRVLYPNDDTIEGKKLRLKQQYFFSSASLKDIVRTFKRLHGTDFTAFPDFYAVQLNDTHPVISIPELIRILVDEQDLDFTAAFEIAQKTFAYTNHTVMQEALEKWNRNLIFSVIPRVYEIIVMINERLHCELKLKGLQRDKVKSMMIVQQKTVHMANLAVYASSYTNGVAAIHTEIIKDTILKDWYQIYPERFQNKTNGITQRRWLALCNPGLSAQITELLHGKEWITDLDRLKMLEAFANDDHVLERFMEDKKANKNKLAEYILQHDKIEIDPTSIFDIQIKRLHEYKRQLLNAFSILYIYYGLKDKTIKNFHPTTYLFGAKSAPGYFRAKGIIKFIGEIAKLVNHDSEVNKQLKVVFISNYNVSYAEKLVVAADISEQISTAGTEASGTGNMKFMLNGTVTLGTFDGANVEIVEQAGEKNNYIFGARVEEIQATENTYDPIKLYNENKKIKRIVDSLVDGTFSDGESGMFKELYQSILYGASWHKPDRYYLLYDLESYVKAKLQCNADYSDSYAFAKKCWLNMCSAGKFSSDRTIKDYAENIWHIS